MPGLSKDRIVGVQEDDLDQYVCPICKDIFDLDNPLVSQLCCQQTFCNFCINEWLKNNGSCPVCREEIDPDELTTPPKALMNLLRNMKIKCEFDEMIVKLDQLAAHLKQCDKNPENNCKTCGILNGTNHNCIELLLNENQRIKDENNLFHEKNKNLIREKINLTMELDDARRKLQQTEEERNILLVMCEEGSNEIKKLGNDIENFQSDIISVSENNSRLNAEILELQIQNKLCKTCGYKAGTNHNCIENLKLVISGLRSNTTMEHSKAVVIHTMEAVIKSARNHINDYEIESPSDRVRETFIELLISKAQKAVISNNSYEGISESIYKELNTTHEQKQWHVIAFDKDGGESLVSGDEFFRIQFDRLVIEVFSTSPSPKKQLLKVLTSIIKESDGDRDEDLVDDLD